MVGINHAGQVRIQVDEKRRLPGRGAWLHPDQNCINHAIQRRAFNRALRKSSPIDTAGLVEWWSIAQLEYFGKSDEKAGRKADGSPMSTQRRTRYSDGPTLFGRAQTGELWQRRSASTNSRANSKSRVRSCSLN